MHSWLTFCAAAAAGLIMASCAADEKRLSIPKSALTCDVRLSVLGVGQDAAAPQIGNHADPAWGANPKSKLLATSLAVTDRRNGARYLFEATPNIAEQLKSLDEIAGPQKSTIDLSAIFITHAHIGHYAGLMFLGREAAGSDNIAVYAMPRLKNFLTTNGPWEQLVTLSNITLKTLSDRQTISFDGGVSVTPYQVPHRDEYSETVGYVISGPQKTALFIPDIDSWDEWEAAFEIKIEDMIAAVDYAFLDATFYSDNELPGRDMRKIPHPRVLTMMTRFEGLSESDRAKINFIHINHTNPIRFAESGETKEVTRRGYNVARRGDSHCL